MYEIPLIWDAIQYNLFDRMLDKRQTGYGNDNGKHCTH